MTQTEQSDSVDEALARIEQRARKRIRKLRWLIPVYVLVGGAVGFAAIHLNPTRHHHTQHHDSTAGTIIGLAVAAAIVIGAGIVAWRLRRRAAGLLSYWRDPPLAAGLDRSDRRVLRRDIRRGTPNTDPVLRAVEEQTVERLTRWQPKWTLWVFPIVPVVMIVNALLPGRSEAGRVYYGILAVLLLVVGVVALRQRRAVDRFPRSAG